jgi:Rtf2 RING-finger
MIKTEYILAHVQMPTYSYANRLVLCCTVTFSPMHSQMRNLFDFLICAVLQFTPNRAYDEAAVGSAAVAQFVCPVTLLEFGGRYPFVAIRCTGYVLAEKAIKEVGLEGLQVHNTHHFHTITISVLHYGVRSGTAHHNNTSCHCCHCDMMQYMLLVAATVHQCNKCALD